MLIKTELNFLASAAGLALEEHLNGTDENIGSLAFTTKAAAGSVFGTGVKLFSGLSEIEGEWLESTLVPLIYNAAGEIIDPWLDRELDTGAVPNPELPRASERSGNSTQSEDEQ